MGTSSAVWIGLLRRKSMGERQLFVNDINLDDIALHFDENLSREQRGTIEESLRALDGVVSVHNSEKAPHLTVRRVQPKCHGLAEDLETGDRSGSACTTGRTCSPLNGGCSN